MIFKNSYNSKAQMQMSVGTIVTIVLLMTVLVLGLVVVRTIFQGATENIDSIDQSVKNEINKLFNEDESRKVVIFPPTRDITVGIGEEGGFGFSIKNTLQDDASFSYAVSVTQVANNCRMTQNEAESLIVLGNSGQLNLPSGSSLENPILVKFSVPESASLCNIRYGIDITANGEQYVPTVSVDLNIE